jgi:hypothetical protein
MERNPLHRRASLERRLEMFGLKSKQNKEPTTKVFGGVVLQWFEDKVIGETFYIHPKDPRSRWIVGVFPHILIPADGRIVLQICISTGSDGYDKLYDPPSSSCAAIVLNANGTIVTVDKHFMKSEVSDQYGKITGTHYTAFPCDAEWLKALTALGQGGPAILRFSSGKRYTWMFNYYDYPVPDENKQLVADVLKAYFALRDEAAAKSQSQPGATAEVKHSLGPFRLRADGSITDADGQPVQRTPDGHTLEQIGPGDFVITYPDGRKDRVGFFPKLGKWQRKPLVGATVMPPGAAGAAAAGAFDEKDWLEIEPV